MANERNNNYNVRHYPSEINVVEDSYYKLKENSIKSAHEERLQRLRTQNTARNIKLVVIILAGVMAVSWVYGKVSNRNTSYSDQIKTGALVNQNSVVSITKSHKHYTEDRVKYYDHIAIAYDIIDITDKDSDLTEFLISDALYDLASENSWDLVFENASDIYYTMKKHCNAETGRELGGIINEESLLEHLVTVYSSPSDKDYADLVKAAQKYKNFRRDNPYDQLSRRQRDLLIDLVKKCIDSHDKLYDQNKDKIEDLAYSIDSVVVDDWGIKK